MDASKIQNVWNMGEVPSTASKNHLDKSNGMQEQNQSESSELYTANDSMEYKDDHRKVSTQTPELQEIERILHSHGSVKDAVAVWRHAEDGEDSEIVAFVTLHTLGIDDETETPVQTSHDHETHDHETQRVQFWDAYWEGCTYTSIDTLEPKTIGRDFLGWTSMYDGKEIDKREMNEWLDETIATILNGAHQLDLLEVGSGSGMILFNLANSLRSYVGFEMSQAAVKFVTKAVKSMPDLANKVHIYQATAAELDFVHIPTSPNLVVINSVIQYFPSRDYLIQVVENLLRLSTARTIFFGDVRSYALYNEFLVSQALHLTGEGPSKAELRSAMSKVAQRELELLVDPAFFTALPSRFPGLIEHVEVLPKRMRATNELSCYRYAAVVYIKDRRQTCQGENIHKVADNDWVDFVHHGLNREQLLHRLRDSPSVVAVKNIPCRKTIFERHVVDWLQGGVVCDTSQTGDWLSSIRQNAWNRPSLSALDLEELAQQASYRVELSWARQYSQRGGLDAIFHKYQTPAGQGRVMFQFPTDHEGREPNTLSSQPLQLQAKQMVREQLDEILQSKMPVHSLPEQITILDDMPVDQNGVVDRRALARWM